MIIYLLFYSYECTHQAALSNFSLSKLNISVFPDLFRSKIQYIALCPFYSCHMIETCFIVYDEQCYQQFYCTVLFHSHNGSRSKNSPSSSSSFLSSAFFFSISSLLFSSSSFFFLSFSSFLLFHSI
jgi:hypothetical protein